MEPPWRGEPSSEETLSVCDADGSTKPPAFVARPLLGLWGPTTLGTAWNFDGLQHASATKHGNLRGYEERIWRHYDYGTLFVGKGNVPTFEVNYLQVTAIQNDV